MKVGRKPKLDPTALQRVDQWLAARPARYKHFKVLAGELGVSINTIFDAVYRRRAYQQAPREN